MAGFFYSAFVAISSIIAGVVAHTNHPHRHQHNPVGIHLGTDFITAMKSHTGAEIEFLIQKEGSLQYKAFMRQNIWEAESNDAPSGIPGQRIATTKNSNSTAYLSTLYGPPDQHDFKNIFSQLKRDLSVALQGAPTNTVVGYPAHASDKMRLLVRSELNSAGSKTLGMYKRPALAVSEQRFDVGNEVFNSHLVLFVDLSAASLELAVLLIEYSTVETLAYSALPGLGEDAHALRIIESLTQIPNLDRFDPTAVRSVMTQLQHFRDSLDPYAVDSVDFSALKSDRITMSSFNQSIQQRVEIRTKHEILQSLESFVIAHTYTGGPQPESGPYKPLRSDLTEMLVTGDASRAGFTSLMRAISNSTVLRCKPSCNFVRLPFP